VTRVDLEIDSTADREWDTWAEALLIALAESEDDTDGLNDTIDDWLGLRLAGAEPLETKDTDVDADSDCSADRDGDTEGLIEPDLENDDEYDALVDPEDVPE
jgi:hypothetical protein